MHIDLTAIKDEEEVALHHEYSPRVEQLDFDDWQYCGAVVLTGTALRMKDSLRVTGTLSGDIAVTCSRCLHTAQQRLTEPFDFTFDITGKSALDITDDIRSQLILLHQPNYLCAATCKGLCPQCGKNMNEGPCTCTKATGTEAFTKLRELFHQKNKEK